MNAVFDYVFQSILNVTATEGWPVSISKVKSLSRVQLFVTPWTVAHQAPQSMGFSRQEYWSGLPAYTEKNSILSQYMKCPEWANLQREMATHSSILAWRIPWFEEPGGLQSTGSQRVGHD